MATLLATDNLLRLRRRRCTLLQRCLELVLGQSDHDVTDVTWELIARIKCCQRFDFMKATTCHCTSDAGVIHITTMQHLTQLRLHDCTQLTDVGCEYIGQGLPQLTELQLRRCSITSAGVAALTHCVPGLTSLDISMCREVDDAACSLHIARCLHDLVELNISSCTSITDAGVASILKSLRKLQRLDISGCRVGDDFLPAVTLSLKLQQQQIRPQLRELQMKYCVAISDRALERIAILLPNLRTLCLASCKRISDEGIEYLGSQRKRRLPHLQTLDLSHCERITNDGACSLLEEHDRGDDNDNDNDNDDDDDITAKSSPQLQSLSLSACTQISRLSALRSSSSCSSIVSLVLSDCIDITDECLCDLTLLSQLRQLRLDGCTRITDAGFCHLIPFLLCLCDLDLTGCLLLTDASVVAISLSCLVTLQPRDRCECRCLE